MSSSDTPISRVDYPMAERGTECAFPSCDCPGETPVCPDYVEFPELTIGAVVFGPDLPRPSPKARSEG